MIAIIVSAAPSEIRNHVEKHGSTVVAEAPQLSQAIRWLLELSPHVVLIDDYQPSQLQLLTELNIKMKATRFVLIDRKSKYWKQEVKQVLLLPPLQRQRNLEIPKRRQVILDPRFGHGAKSQSKNSSEITAGWDHTPETQELRLLWMLRTARQHRCHAQAHRDAVAHFEGLEFQ
jgi:hypothetical protein